MKLTDEQLTAISADIAADNVEAIRAWIESGLDPEKALGKYMPYNLLQLAAAAGATKIVRYLIESGVNINKGVRKWTPLMEATGPERIEVARILLEAGADPDLKSGADDEGDSEMTALMMAAEDANIELVRMLLEAGADPTAITQKGRGAINFALNVTREDRMKLVQMLVDAGCPISPVCLEGPVWDEDVAMVRYLLAHGANPNVTSTKQDYRGGGWGTLPLHTALLHLLAAEENSERRKPLLEILEELVNAGAEMSLPTSSILPLYQQKLETDAEVTEILRRAGRQGLQEEAPAPPPPAAAVRPSRAEGKSANRVKASEAGGVCEFLEFMSIGNQEWSVLAVEAPVDAVSEAFVRLRKPTEWKQDVYVDTLGNEYDTPLDYIPVLQLKEHSWTVLIRSLFEVSDELRQVREEARVLSSELKTRAVTFMAEDTSGVMGYELYDNGVLVEKANWGGGFDSFESQLREKPKWPDDENKAADQAFRELGVYIPPCCAVEDSRHGERLGIRGWARKNVARADLVSL